MEEKLKIEGVEYTIDVEKLKNQPETLFWRESSLRNDPILPIIPDYLGTDSPENWIANWKKGTPRSFLIKEDDLNTK